MTCLLSTCLKAGSCLRKPLLKWEKCSRNAALYFGLFYVSMKRREAVLWNIEMASANDSILLYVWAEEKINLREIFTIENVKKMCADSEEVCEETNGWGLKKLCLLWKYNQSLWNWLYSIREMKPQSAWRPASFSEERKSRVQKWYEEKLKKKLRATFWLQKSIMKWRRREKENIYTRNEKRREMKKRNGLSETKKLFVKK